MTAVALPSTFEALEDRYRIHAEIVAQTALRVGAGKAQDPVATDQPIMRDALGRPFLPGSSLKGALRSGLERVLRGLSSNRRQGLWACDLFADDGENVRCTATIEERLRKDRNAVDFHEILASHCTICGLFGSTLLGGRLFVHDLPVVKSDLTRTEIRDGVGINRDLRTAQAKIKYDTETVAPGTRFALEILLENPDDLQRALVLKALAMLHDGSILLGGMTSRGLGRVQLDHLKLERTNAERLLQGQGYEPREWDEAQTEASQTLAAHVAQQGGADSTLEDC